MIDRSSRPTTVRATVMQATGPDHLEVLPNQLIEIDADGRIAAMPTPSAEVDDVVADVTLSDATVLIPGLIDTHLHAPQWEQRGVGLDLPLDEWLHQYTFPLEASFVDSDRAVTVWNDMVPSLLAEGTTTVVYHSSIHEDATLALAEACVHHGQRAFVGRVAMDHPQATPEFYRDASAQAGVEATVRSIDAIRALPGDLVEPIVTPRFVPSCTDELMAGLGLLVRTHGVRTQTHCSESIWQHGESLRRYGCSDTEALDGFGLLADHTVLAHGVHISDTDRSMLIDRGSGVAHCPLSNTYFGDGVFPVRRHLDAGLRIGLGTDIAGGPEPSMLASCGHAVASSRMLEAGVAPERTEWADPGARIDLVTAFWLATGGGAELLGIDAGVLSPGRVFDAVSIDLGDTGSLPSEAPARRFERAIRGQGTVTAVWVDGTRRIGH